MSQDLHSTASGPSHRWVESGMAVFTAVFALTIIAGSLQVGVGWADDGPRAGFFPFYVGLFILAASLVNFTQAVSIPRERMFAEWGQLWQVVSVVLPAAVYVALVPWVGIYLSSMLLIAVFMRWLGQYGWTTVAPIAVGVPVLIFIVFERWFLVPLPKGPVENMLGF